MHLGLGSAAEWPYRAKAAALCGKLAASPAAALQRLGASCWPMEGSPLTYALPRLLPSGE